MTWKEMLGLEPELARLEASARFAGEHGAAWLDVLFATNEALTKATGRGAFHEELQDAASYEVARAAIYLAWQSGSKVMTDTYIEHVKATRWPREDEMFITAEACC